MTTTPTVCIVDDSADYRLLLQRLFRQSLPNQTLRLYEGGQALLMDLALLESKPGLILLDRHMPDMDGHQVLIRLKEHPDYRTIPVVMMSAEASNIEINGCYTTGVNSFVLKSMDFNVLTSDISLLIKYWLGLNEPYR